MRRQNGTVRTFVFRCPTTGYNVQGRYEVSTGPLPAFVGQHCLACNGLHVIDPRTGKGMSELRAVAARRQSSDPTTSDD
ncbi:MAG: hypothetical protein FD144_4453 [Rhodospirillaceae bacterium]|nr:MAG: hypothetical protein FD144_4453 [Rhodospirillaceae bacterium]